MNTRRKEKKNSLEYYCNHCDTTFDGIRESNGDIACPQCGVGVVTRNFLLTHPANKPLLETKAREIISWLGWRDFKRLYPMYTEEHPELRPKKRETE